jgi:hypothetical protein
MSKSLEQKREYQRQYRARKKTEFEAFIEARAREHRRIVADYARYNMWADALIEAKETTIEILQTALDKARLTGLRADVEHANTVNEYWTAYIDRMEHAMLADPAVQRVNEREERMANG